MIPLRSGSPKVTLKLVVIPDAGRKDPHCVLFIPDKSDPNLWTYTSLPPGVDLPSNAATNDLRITSDARLEPAEPSTRDPAFSIRISDLTSDNLKTVHAVVEAMKAAPPATPPPPPPACRKCTISAYGVVDDTLIHEHLLSNCHSPFLQTDQGGLYICVEDQAKAERWLLGFCAANNRATTFTGDTEAIGTSILHRHMKTTPDGQTHIAYATAYLGIGRPPSSANDRFNTAYYGANPETDFGISNIPHAFGLDSDLGSKWASRLLGNFSQRVEISPSFGYDSGYGPYQNTTAKITPWPKVIDKDGNPVDSSPLTPLSLQLNGQASFVHDYYSAKASPKWTLSDDAFLDASLNGTVSKSLDPYGANGDIKNQSKGGLALAQTWKVPDTCSNDELDYSLNIGGNFASTLYQEKTTDEYGGTISPQLLYRFFSLPGSIHAAPVPDGVFDATAWFTPTEAAEGGHFYSDGIARVHFGSDIPAWASQDPENIENIQFFRVDFAVTGGGLMGVPGDGSDLFSGATANKFYEGTSGSDAPPLVVRSMDNKAQVLSINPATVKNAGSGAETFANANLTVAIPIPGLSRSFVYGKSRNGLEAAAPTLAKYKQPAEDNIDYAANLSGISFKPLFACDAAWLGAPGGYNDRNMVAVGGGGELSLGTVNFDLLYAVTVHDTANQPHGENILFQATYDLHF